MKFLLQFLQTITQLSQSPYCQNETFYSNQTKFWGLKSLGSPSLRAMPKWGKSSGVGILILSGTILASTPKPAIALNLTSVDGVWANITSTGSSPPHCLDTSGNSPSNAQITYGSSNFSRCRTPKSGFRFEDGPAQTVTIGDNFVLGQFTHVNNPIFAFGNNLNTADINATLVIDGQTVNLSYRITLDETPNSGTCAYGSPGDTPCPDRTLIATLTGTITLNSVQYLVTGGFVNNPSGNITACDPNASPGTVFVTQEGTENYACVLAKIEGIPRKISGQIRNDIDNDGNLSDNESGINNVTVQLFADDGSGNPTGSALQTQTTNSSGNYTFTNVLPDNYIVVETDPSGFVSTADTGGANDNRIPVTVANNDLSGNDFLDYKPPSTFSISGQVRDDVDSDGDLNDAENGINNVTVQLFADDGSGQPTGSALQTVLTDGSGNYLFSNVSPGTYVIVETNSTNYNSTNDEDGVNDDKIVVTIGSSNITSQDFLDSNSIPNVLLVKRITAINSDITTSDGTNLAIHNPTPYAYDDNDIPAVSDPNDPAYNETDPAFDPYETNQWPTPLNTSMPGGTDGGNVMPNDEIEYTIYYLSSGDATAESVLFCDYVPEFTSFIPNAYMGSTPQATGGLNGADLSIELFRNGTTDYHTSAGDGDSATYFPPGADPTISFPDVDCDGNPSITSTNTNGAVVVNLGDLPDATSDATGAYGYVRFRARVK